MTDTKRTPELEQAILHAMSCGVTLTAACKEQGIHYVTWRKWCREDAELDIAHAQARDQGYDVIADDCMSIADDGRRDYAPSEDGREVVDHDHIQRSKLRIETRLKLLSKWDPKRYGDRINLDHSGTIQQQTDEQIESRLLALTKTE